MSEARAIGAATISFGLVSIPVKIFSAALSTTGVSFSTPHKHCGARLKQHLHCPAHEGVVEKDDQVRGYEFAKDQFVTFTEEELEALEEKASETVAIAEFLPAAGLDPVFFEKAYYLVPEKGGEKAYALLGAALEKTGRVALARYAARGKAYFVALRPAGKRLAMHQLRHADEVRPVAELPEVAGDDAFVRDELRLALRLVDQSAVDRFKPEKYKDTAKKRALAAIEKKIATGEAITAEPEPGPAPIAIADLAEALRASLKGEERKPPKAKAPRAPAATREKRSRAS